MRLEVTECQARQFTELFTANYGPVLAYVQRRVGADLAQDVVADTFLAAWRNIHELPPDPLPWLYRAAQFAVANQRRTLPGAAGWTTAHGFRRRVPLPLITPTGRRRPRTRRGVPGAERGRQGSAAARCLGGPERRQEIGVVVGCSAVAAKARLRRARQRLSRRLATAVSRYGLRSLVSGATIKGTGI